MHETEFLKEENNECILIQVSITGAIKDIFQITHLKVKHKSKSLRVCVCVCLFLFIIQPVLQLLNNWVHFHGRWYGLQFLCPTFNYLQSVTGGAVGSGTAVRAGKSRVRFPTDGPGIDSSL